MGIDANKQLATVFFSRFSANDVAGALDTLADDLTWWIAGKPGAQPASGEHDKAWIAGKISAVREYLDTQHVVATWFAPAVASS